MTGGEGPGGEGAAEGEGIGEVGAAASALEPSLVDADRAVGLQLPLDLGELRPELAVLGQGDLALAELLTQDPEHLRDFVDEAGLAVPAGWERLRR